MRPHAHVPCSYSGGPCGRMHTSHVATREVRVAACTRPMQPLGRSVRPHAHVPCSYSGGLCGHMIYILCRGVDNFSELGGGGGGGGRGGLELDTAFLHQRVQSIIICSKCMPIEHLHPIGKKTGEAKAPLAPPPPPPPPPLSTPLLCLHLKETMAVY